MELFVSSVSDYTTELNLIKGINFASDYWDLNDLRKYFTFKDVFKILNISYFVRDATKFDMRNQLLRDKDFDD